MQRPDGKVVAVQTTQLSAAGTKAAVTPCRITTGALGAAAARFAKATDMLGLAEGTETALAAMQLTGLPCWASLGAGRMHRICVPSTVRELHVFADADEPGRVAAERTADAHTKAGRRVVFRFPPQGSKDFADLLAKVAA